MAFFSRFFSTQLSQRDQLEEASDLIHQAKELSIHSSKNALKLLHKQSTPLSEVLGIGGAMHKPYRELILMLWSRRKKETAPELPTVEVIPWSTWENPRLKDLQIKAQEMKSEILFCKKLELKRYNPLLQLEALRCFVASSRTAMVTIFEEDMMFRKSFVLEAASSLNPELEEIGQELEDYANSTGKQAINL